MTNLNILEKEKSTDGAPRRFGVTLINRWFKNGYLQFLDHRCFGEGFRLSQCDLRRQDGAKGQWGNLSQSEETDSQVNKTAEIAAAKGSADLSSMSLSWAS